MTPLNLVLGGLLGSGADNLPYNGLPAAYRLLQGMMGWGESGTPQQGNPDQVRTQPVYRTPPSAQGGFGGVGGILGGGSMSPYQSFNPMNSPSARMFDQYMQQAMRQYGGPGGFFGFSGYQFPQAAAPVAQQPDTPPVGSTPWQQQNSWWGNTVGGGN